MQESVEKNELVTPDVIEDDIRTQMPQILEILLLDRTTSSPKSSQNIIWANDNYKEYDAVSYAATAQIRPELITGKRGELIMPRALKAADLQKKRTKTKAEVFTPTWIVKKQNDVVDRDYKTDDLETYTRRKWLEITCGEAPYMASRYDMGTGEVVPLSERVGFIDRKLAWINREATDKADWQRLVELAFKASYGFEWNGDSLLLARENLLYTYRDYYIDKWGEPPIYGLFAGLEPEIPDKDARLKHILEHQVYGFAPSEIIYNIARNFVFGGFADISDSHLQCRDLTETAKNGGNLGMKFDVVVGNPPYQESGESRDEPIYHYFYDLAEQTSQRYCLISPARFLFNAGQTPKTWNAKMLDDKHLKVEFYEQNSASVFANTDIKGGVAIVYRDRQQVYGGIGVFTHYDELNSIVSKTTKLSEVDFSTIVQPQGIYRFSELFFTTFPQAEDMQGKGTKNKIVSKSFSQMDFAFHNEKTASDEISMLGLTRKKSSSSREKSKRWSDELLHEIKRGRAQ